MTKDWDVVQDEIKELSFNQKKPLEEVKELMERKHNFKASTRAYRMRLKEWGLTRHSGRGRKPRAEQNGNTNVDTSSANDVDDEEEVRAQSTNAELTPVNVESLEHRTTTDTWQLISDTNVSDAQLHSVGILSQGPNVQPSVETPGWMLDAPIASETVLDMLECILNIDCTKLERLLMEHMNVVNEPIGMPFEAPDSRFAKHPALTQMVILQHSRQTLLDIASAMPNGPVVWLLLSYGARGSIHPLGTDLALHNAIKNGRHYTVQALLVPGRSDVNGLPDKHWRPLLQAVFWTGPEIVGILLKRGARVDDAGPSPIGSGMYTALQLCLDRRAREYNNEAMRSRCNDNLKLLLNAGASIHVPPPDGTTSSAFDMFIEPWQDTAHWNLKMSMVEFECLGKFIEKGADLSAKFVDCPCSSGSRDTFIHQAIWHLTPCFPRYILENFRPDTSINGATILHELVGLCPESKRHGAEVLKDLGTLLSHGVNPNVLDDSGMTPLTKCVHQASFTDVVAITQKLLDSGADPEHEDADGTQPYIFAALFLKDPARFEVVQAMLTKMQGRSTRTKDGRICKWENGLFPIPEHPTYAQVLSSTMPQEDLQLSMQEMLPIGARPVFLRAYISIISSRLLEDIAKAAASNRVTEKDRWTIMLVLSLRRRTDLPNYLFDQGLVIALLDFPMVDIPTLDSAAAKKSRKSIEKSAENTKSPGPAAGSAPSVTDPAHTPFKLNSKSPSNLPQTSSVFSVSQDPDTSNDAFVGDTTQLRWLNPEQKGIVSSAAPYVVQYKCPTCADDRKLTKAELKKHEIEHAHTAGCDGVGCARRFCKDTRKRKTRGEEYQDNLFPVNI